MCSWFVKYPLLWKVAYLMTFWLKFKHEIKDKLVILTWRFDLGKDWVNGWLEAPVPSWPHSLCFLCTRAQRLLSQGSWRAAGAFPGADSGRPGGREACRALVAAMCKQLYWSWVSTFTSGIRLEERQAADGKALQQQVCGLAPCASCVILAQEARFGFWLVTLIFSVLLSLLFGAVKIG